MKTFTEVRHGAPSRGTPQLALAPISPSFIKGTKVNDMLKSAVEFFPTSEKPQGCVFKKIH